MEKVDVVPPLIDVSFGCIRGAGSAVLLQPWPSARGVTAVNPNETNAKATNRRIITDQPRRRVLERTWAQYHTRPT